MRSAPWIATGLVTALAATAADTTAAPPVPARAAANSIVIHGTLKSMAGRTATYASRRGRYTATWIGRRHYRISGRIDGRRLSGSFRTRQTSSRTSYRASGSGRLGGRRVRISGGGPNSLRRTTLILRW